MIRASHPLADWLGPALDELSDEQLEQLTAESKRINARYPDDDQDDLDLRDAALSAAVQMILGETTPDEVMHELTAARKAAWRASAAAQQVAVMLVAADVSEVEAARRVGIDRNTLRSALGKARKPQRRISKA